MMRTVPGTKRDSLPTGVFAKGRWYYRVRAEGPKRVWSKLSRIDAGLPALYAALAQQLAANVIDERVPAVIAAWQRDVMPAHAAKTQRDEIAMCIAIASEFEQYKASDVEPKDCAAFLKAYKAQPRTFNAYRGMLREVLRYSCELGFRTTNPLDHIKTLPTPARTRYITDSELRRIKVGGIYEKVRADGNKRTRTRSGLMLAALIDVAYLTGQRIGDLLELRWRRDPDDVDAPHLTEAGLRFRPAKTRKKTGAAVVITWTPRLHDAIERMRKLQAERLLKRRADQRIVSGYVFTGQDGTPMSYWGASSAWRRACARAGVAGVHFHDIRAKALTDKELREGMQAARTMGTHATESQTAEYVRGRSARKTGATR